MARSRPHGWSKSDHRVCQAARYARAAEYRERITISAEQQEERIAALNAECSVEDAPRRRRRQKSRESKTQGGAARLSARGSSCKASRSGKKKATKRVEHALGKAAKRDPHSLLCHTCCATAEFGLRGGKEGGCVRYFCKAHAMPSGCFRIDKDRAAWLEERELHHHLKAEVDRLEGELQQLGGASSTARPTSAWSDFPCAGDWVSKPMSFLLIATLLTIGGVESNPGPSIEEIAAIRESWLRANPKMDDTLVAYLVEQELDFASWMNQSDRDQDQSLSDLEAAYTKSRGNWKISWSVAIRAAVSSISLPQNAEIEESWPEANPRMEPALVAYLAEQELDLASWIKQSDRARVQSLAELTAAFTKSKGAWKMSWTVAIRSAAAEAVRRRHKAGAGQSTDVEMRDADQGDQNHAGQSGIGGSSGSGQLTENERTPLDVSQWLLAEYGDMLRKTHSREPLGALRDGGFDPDGNIQDHLKLQGREEAFECWISLTANIFSSWKRRNPAIDKRDYTRHLVHLLLLSCPGSGKTTFLTHSLRWLREWLKKDESYLIGWLGGAMFGVGELSSGNKLLVQEVLGALRIAAGSNGYHTFGLLRVEEEGVSTTVAETADEITAANAPALRLLYALLCPLDGSPSDRPPGGYFTFVRKFSQKAPGFIKNHIRIPDVVAFAREGLQIPEGALFVIPLLIDEGNIAEGVFLNENPPQTGDHPTWLKWTLSKIVFANNDDTSNLNLIVPMTATTRWESPSLQWTASGQAEATYIPLKPLSLDERKALICDLASRVAAYNGRPAVGQNDLPQALRDDGLNIVGGNPRLITWLLDSIGGRSWASGLDEAVKAITSAKLVNAVKKVKKTAYEQLKLKRIIDLMESPELKKSCLQVVIATMMLDKLVKRNEKLRTPSGLELPVTWGELEADGVVELRPLLGIGAPQTTNPSSEAPGPSDPSPLQELPTVSPSATQPVPAPFDSSLASQSTPQPPSPSSLLAGPSSPGPQSSPPPGLSVTPRPGPSTCSSPVSGSSPPFNVLDESGQVAVMYRNDVGLLVEDESESKSSPGKLGMLNHETACPQPTSEPGDELVQVTMGFFMYTLLLERMDFVAESELSTFSEAMVRESPLDKEKGDAMAVPLKMQALHMLGESDFSLTDALPNLRVPAELAKKRFVVPPGPLTVGDGLPMGEKVSKENFGKIVADIANKIHERVKSKKWGTEALNIGFIGPGNDGWDSFVVLLEAGHRDAKKNPWVLFCQSKQESSPTMGYVTLIEILRNFESDVQQTPFKLPALPPEWVQWQNKETEARQMKEAAPAGGQQSGKACTIKEPDAPAGGGGKQAAKGAELTEAGEAGQAGQKQAGKRPRPKEPKQRTPGGESELVEGEETAPSAERAGKRRRVGKAGGPAQGGKKEESKGRKRKEQDEPAGGEVTTANKKQKGEEFELRKADTLPEEEFSSDWTSNIIYTYVTDRRFSEKQVNLLKEVEGKDHPWLRRMLIVSRQDQDSWYSRIGALGRSATLHWLSQKVMLKKD